VTLTVTDNDGATDTATSVKTILNRSPVASFTESATTVPTGTVIHFNASDSYDPDGSIVSYSWDFGDGYTGTGVIISRAYSDNGTYTVTLTVTDDDGETDTATSIKTVLNRSPVAVIIESAETVYTGEVIHFNASDSYDPDGSIVSYSWNFGDGYTGTGVTIDHAYADNGTYTVTLTVTDNDGATGIATHIKIVGNRPPVASFTESAETVYTNVVITFNASSSYDPDGTIVSYSWDFGDGYTGTGVTVDHAYADNGTCTVTLTVTDNDGATGSANSVKTILNRSPTASFTESATTVPTGTVIHFNASASYDPDGVIVSYAWNFGDGESGTGMIVDHVYVDNGTYTVTLTVTDDDGATDITTSTKTILNRPPVASFTESAETVYTNMVIHFNASDSYDPDGSIVSYSWDFGDGNTGTGVLIDHAYVDNGTYTVTLTVTDDDGETDTAMSVKTVLNRSPVAVIIESAETVYTNEVIHFNASDSYDPDGVVISYFWNFGDGYTSTDMIVDHAYADNGTYTVTLTVTDNDGATGLTSHVKTVLNRSPVANFTESATTVLTDEVIHFDASASYDPDGSIASYAWNFGDGYTGSGVAVDHSYSDNGTYTVTLTVTDDDGATGIVAHTKTVLNRAPVANFTESATTVYTGVSIHFDASISSDPDGSIISYSWDFGDGYTGTGVTVDHAYADNGTYTVTLTVTDDDGATASRDAVKTVLNRSPVADFTYSPPFPYANLTITFNASASYDSDGSIISYFWDFGDGNTTTGTIVEHTYEAAGNYTVTLNVTDNDGAVGTTSKIVSVTVAPPDVAVLSVVPSTNEAYLRQLVNIAVVVKNEGLEAKTFNVTVYRNDTVIGIQTVTDLAAGSNTTLLFVWSTSSVSLGNYTIRAEATMLPGEEDTADNVLIDGVVKVRIADANGDGIVNVFDLTLLGRAWFTEVGNPNYDPRVDLTTTAKSMV